MRREVQLPGLGALTRSESAEHAERWARRVRDRVVHQDSEAHVALVLRTLGVDEALFRRALDAHVLERERGADTLAALAAAWSGLAPHTAPLPSLPPSVCPACGARDVAPWLARGVSGAPALVLGRCGKCGHGVTLAGGAGAEVYDARYYASRDPGGAGYADYSGEQSYREAKGERVLDFVQARGMRPLASLLEVGSGFGFTRRAAERRGWRTAGVDQNPEARRGAEQLYGMPTHTGTLGAALDAGAVEAGAWDVVLYQFVLEHVPDPVAELSVAARAVSPGGVLALTVPSMDAAELEVFGASYRSLRRDHLQLFSRRSMQHVLERAGWALCAWETECSVHLLAGFLSASELCALYAEGRGPDAWVLAETRSA